MFTHPSVRAAVIAMAVGASKILCHRVRACEYHQLILREVTFFHVCRINKIDFDWNDVVPDLKSSHHTACVDFSVGVICLPFVGLLLSIWGDQPRRP